MKFSVRFFSSLYISLLCVGVSSSVSATQTDKPARWFEIEVILFKQLSDKKLLKEQFPDNISSTNLPQYKKHVDLLTPYLQPNLSAIKQFMPLCGEKDAQHAFLESLQKVNTPFPNAIKAIEHVEGFNMPEFTTDNKAIEQPEYKVTDVSRSNSELARATTKNTKLKTPQNLTDNNKSRTLNYQLEFSFDLQEEELASPLFSTQNLCIISRKDIEQLFSDEQVTNFQLDAFDVAALPSKLNASGAHISDSPYLIANESLRLADIKQRLRWSKEFKPLLHFGWRQVAVTRKKAIPIKLFAGEHLDYQYQHALDDYQSALNETKLAEQLIAQQLTLAGQQEIDKTTLPAEHNKNNDTAIKQQQLTQLFTDIKRIESANINNIIAKLERQTFGELIAIDNVSMDENERLNVNNPPVKPLQPWFLDGFLKVHLDHYLYITADFNLVNQSLNKNSNNDTDSAQVKLINFNQNKRVITGEIHYFDHPYIGMIVQIRRFDPSKPKEEAVTQVIN
ncbi:MAG: hypothetical protein HRT51_18775 [Colwellia sp.]|nr:hypothetical protein [Colwellia sp.]